MPIFKDWSGSKVAYRFVPTEPEDTEARVCCEIDPHAVGEWTSFGRGLTDGAALRVAIEAWNAYDRQPV